MLVVRIVFSSWINGDSCVSTKDLEFECGLLPCTYTLLKGHTNLFDLSFTKCVTVELIKDLIYLVTTQSVLLKIKQDICRASE